MIASARQGVNTKGVPGDVAFLFPQAPFNRIPDRERECRFAFYGKSAWSFKFPSMILLLSLGHCALFPARSTHVSQSAGFFTPQ